MRRRDLPPSLPFPPHRVLQPRLFQDGGSWCSLFGPDMVDGICGYGDTRNAANADFDRDWAVRGLDDLRHADRAEALRRIEAAWAAADPLTVR